MPTAVAKTDALLEKTNAVFEYQNNRIVEARERLWLVLLGLFTPGAHTLLWGPPGVAKSMLFDGFSRHAPEMNWFKTPAFKGSPPEQFLGPISLSAMTDPENERYERIVKGKFPWAEYVLVDELLRAPRAVLPVFQTGMSDGMMDNGNGLERIPLRTFYAATNHLVETGDDDLAAFNDRFILKIVVEPVQAQASFINIMEGFLHRRAYPSSSEQVPDELILSRKDIDTLITQSCVMEVPFEVLEALAQLRSNLLTAGIEPSVRRTNNLISLLQTDALLRGQDTVTIENIQLAKHSLWTDIDEKEQVETAVLEFASEAEKEAAKLSDEFDEMRADYIQLQADFAQTGAAAVTSAMTDSGLRLLRNHQLLRPRIEKHIAEAAAGRDVHRLVGILDEMTSAREWISSNLLGGLDV